MPKSRSKRKANDQDVSSTPMPTVNKSRRSGRPVNTNSDKSNTSPSASNTSNTIPSANEIASSLFQQFREAGLTLTRASDNSVPVTETSFANILSSPVNDEPPNSGNQSGSASYVTVEKGVPPTQNPEKATNGEVISSDISNINAFSLLKNSLPLDFHVDEKIKSVVHAEKYVKFATLLPNSVNETSDCDVLFENSNVTISKKKSRAEINSILVWTSAFDIFCSIYLCKFPNESLALIKYGYNIRSMSKQFGFQAANLYDEQFRQVKKVLNLEWSTINDELWRRAAYGLNSPSRNQNQLVKGSKGYNSYSFPRKAQQQYPLGFCWAYCRSGECSNKGCQLKHQCARCGLKHATSICNESQNKLTLSRTSSTGSNPNKGK